MRNLRLSLILFAAASMNSAFGTITVTNSVNLVLTGPVLNLPGANNGAGEIADVTGGVGGSLVPYTEVGANPYSGVGGGRTGTYGAHNLNDADVGIGVATDSFHAIPDLGTDSVVVTFTGGSQTITSIAIYHGYDGRDGADFVLKDASGNIIGEWESLDNDSLTEHYWLNFPTPVTTTGLRIETSSNATSSGGSPTPSFREIQVFSNVVTTTADIGAGSLRQAIANALPGATINFDPSLSGQTITLGGSILNVTKPVTIDASALLPHGITIDGENTTGVFQVSTGAGTEVTFDSLTITRGNGFAGGIDYSSSGSLSVLNCTFVDNSGFGGGIFQGSSGVLLVSNSTFTGNMGGAIYSNGGDLTVRNSTIVGNDEAGMGIGSGGGILLEFGNLTLENSIVAGNTGGSDPDISKLNASTIIASGLNLIGDNASVGTDFPAGPLVGTTASPLDPMLAPLGSYGGPTPTMYPLPGSPVIDPAGGSTTSALAFDQRGFARVVDGNIPSDGTATVDIGAVEADPPPPITVVNTNDTGAGSLRQAVDDVLPGGTIDFDPSLSGQIITLESYLAITRAVTIDASGLARGITLNLDGSQIAPSGAALTLNSLDLSGGGNSQYIIEGFDNSPLNLLNCTIRDSGNGISLFANAPVTISNCTFTNNGLGFYYFGNGGVASITNTTIAGNSRDGITLEAGEIVLKNSIVANNGTEFFIRDSVSFTTVLTDAGGNLIGDNTGVETEFPDGPLVGTGASPLDPMLSPLGYYGGPLQTMHPLIGSPAIDPAGGATSSSLTTDQRGFPRVIDGGRTTAGAIVDIGAVEAGPVLEVTDNSGGFGAPGSLRTHLSTAGADPANAYHIAFDPAVFPATIEGSTFTASSTVFVDASDIGGPGVQLKGTSSDVFSIGAAAQPHPPGRQQRSPLREFRSYLGALHDLGQFRGIKGSGCSF